jgi:hypothetical protein
LFPIILDLSWVDAQLINLTPPRQLNFFHTLDTQKSLILMTIALSALEFLSQVNNEVNFSPLNTPTSSPQFTFTQELSIPPQLKLDELFVERNIPIEPVFLKNRTSSSNAFQFLDILNGNSSFFIENNEFATELVKKKPSWLHVQFDIASCVTRATIIRARHTY